MVSPDSSIRIVLSVSILLCNMMVEWQCCTSILNVALSKSTVTVGNLLIYYDIFKPFIMDEPLRKASEETSMRVQSNDIVCIVFFLIFGIFSKDHS